MASLLAARAMRGKLCARRMALTSFHFSTSATVAYPRNKNVNLAKLIEEELAKEQLAQELQSEDPDTAREEAELLNKLWDEWATQRAEKRGLSAAQLRELQASSPGRDEGESETPKRLHPNVTINDATPEDQEEANVVFLDQLMKMTANDPKDAMRFLETVARDNGAPESQIKIMAPKLIEAVQELNQAAQENEDVVQAARNRNKYRAKNNRPETIQKPWPGPWQKSS